ncbi:MAG: 2-hydroxyacid dehydrogenase [Sciscionella sp.]
MTSRVLLPWADFDTDDARWPGLVIDTYDGMGAAPEDVADVEFYVLPYDRGGAPVELLNRMPALRAVQSLSAGVEKLLPLMPPGARLCNGRGLHDASAAEHALALILAAQRDLPRWLRQQTLGTWQRKHTRSLADARVTIVGYGSIGRAAERRLLAAEALVTRVASRARPHEDVHGVNELPELLGDTDILLLILPESPATVGLIGAKELAMLSDDALVVNIGRGRTLDTAALQGEIAAGRLRAALDVVDPEPLPANNPLWRSECVIITPHVAGGSASFYPRARALVDEQLRRFAGGEQLLHVVPTDR